MYICTECHHVFDEPSSQSAESYYGVSGLFSHSCGEKVSSCPYCGGAYEEAMLCAGCEDEYISTKSSHPFCESCQKKIIKRFVDEFREDEYDFIYDYYDGKSYKELESEVK